MFDCVCVMGNMWQMCKFMDRPWGRVGAYHAFLSVFKLAVAHNVRWFRCADVDGLEVVSSLVRKTTRRCAKVDSVCRLFLQTGVLFLAPNQPAAPLISQHQFRGGEERGVTASVTSVKMSLRYSWSVPSRGLGGGCCSLGRQGYDVT